MGSKFVEKMRDVHKNINMIKNRCVIIRLELDGYSAKRYGLIRDELRYILDAKDVYGPDFPGETFGVERI